jgi:hypothetical protein
MIEIGAISKAEEKKSYFVHGGRSIIEHMDKVTKHHLTHEQLTIHGQFHESKRN